MAVTGKEVMDNVVDKVKTTAAAAAEVANSIGKKASNRMEVARINAKIGELKKEIEALYESIGERVYQTNAEVVNKAIVAELIEAIDEKYIKIKDSLYRAAELKGLIICPSCGRECDNEDDFCSKCGAKLPKEEDEVLE